jgi:hypothetical protein
MKKTGIFLFILSVVLTGADLAYGQEKKESYLGRGLSAQAELGLPTVSIANPDGTNAYYTGVTVLGRGILPLIDGKLFSINLVGNAKYLDLRNTANSGSQKEYANHIGGGVGASINLWIFFYGIDYNYMFARHYAVGTISRELNFNYSTAMSYYGVQKDFGQLSLGGGMSLSSATISKRASGLSADSPYTEKIYFVFARYSTGLTIPRMFKALFSGK